MEGSESEKHIVVPSSFRGPKCIGEKGVETDGRQTRKKTKRGRSATISFLFSVGLEQLFPHIFFQPSLPSHSLHTYSERPSAAGLPNLAEFREYGEISASLEITGILTFFGKARKIAMCGNWQIFLLG